MIFTTAGLSRRGGVQSERPDDRRRATPETVKLYERRIDPLPLATRKPALANSPNFFM